MEIEKTNKNTALDELSVYVVYDKAVGWLKYIRSKLVIIGSVAALFGLLGFFYADYFNKRTYTADLVFSLEDGQSQSSAFSGALGLASSFGIDIGGGGGGAFSGNNLIELIKTRKLMESVLLDTFQTNNQYTSGADRYIEIMHWRENWEKRDPSMSKQARFPLGQPRNAYSRMQDSVLGVIYTNISTKDISVGQVDKKVSFIKVSFRSVDENFAQQFTQRLAAEVSQLYKLTKSAKAKQNVDILVKQVDSVKRELNAAITGVAMANDNTFSLNPALNVPRAPSLKRQVDVQAGTAVLVELAKNLEIARMTLLRETPLIQVIDEPILPLSVEGKKRVKTMLMWALVAAVISCFFLICRKIIRDMNLNRKFHERSS